MCGRYTLVAPYQIALHFGVDWDPTDVAPRYNIAPSMTVPTVRDSSTGPVIIPMQWGFRTPFRGRIQSAPPPINARAETLRERPLFRGALTKQRCIIPANGFYEWQVLGGKAKQPWYYKLKDGSLFGFAGLYSEFENDNKEIESTFVIITTEPNDLVAPVHDRMPAILSPDSEHIWLDSDVVGEDQLTYLLTPTSSALMDAYPVAALVSSPANDRPALIEPFEPPVQAQFNAFD